MSKENLYSKEAKEKLKEMAESVEVAMFATNLSKLPLSIVPMHTKKVDENGNIWFLSGADSDHNRDILKNKKAQLIYSHPGDMKYLSVFGTAEIVSDQSTINELYSKMDNAWFDGPEDASVTAIKFSPKEAAYWNNDNNKFVTLFKLGVAAVTGEDQNIGTSGKMKV